MEHTKCSAYCIAWGTVFSYIPCQFISHETEVWITTSNMLYASDLIAMTKLTTHKSITAQSMISANNWARYGLKVVFFGLHIIISHYHQYSNLSEDIKHIKCLSVMSCQVCVYNQVIKSIVFIKLHVMHESVDFQLTNFFFWWWREYVYFIQVLPANRKHESLSILMVVKVTKTMVYAVCLALFLTFQ